MNNDTIFALSSGHGKSGVAVIRISGDNLGDMFADLSGRKIFDARHAYFANMRDTTGNLIDQVILIYFSAPNSFTGTDVIEIHCHGAGAVIEKIFSDLAARGARMAIPGEFSRRAFYAGKMDLADIDGLAALLDARTDMQRKSALQSMMGRDSDVYSKWRTQMIEISAYAAAMLDYADDELPPNIGDTIRVRAQKLYDEISTAISRYATARAMRSGFNITLAGETNVGKSSIFNYLVGSNRAIVSDIPGTTRDIVSATLDIGGYLVNLSDTAGLRQTDDTIEKIGIDKTRAEIQNSDLIIRVYDATTAQNITPAVDNEIVVINKSDTILAPHAAHGNDECIFVSAKTGFNMDNLMQRIGTQINKIMDGAENTLAINERTRVLLNDAMTELENAIKLSGDNYDIFSEHIRRAADAIGKILGTITAAEVMDATFGQLCLGK